MIVMDDKLDNSVGKVLSQTERCNFRAASRSVRFQLPWLNCINASSGRSAEGKREKEKRKYFFSCNNYLQNPQEEIPDVVLSCAQY